MANKIMPAPSYANTKEELIECMRVTNGSGNRSFDIAKAILDVKLQEDVANQTGRLTFATWGLVFVTIVLVIAAICPFVIRAIHAFQH